MCNKSAVSTPLRGERECLQAQVRAAAGGSAAVSGHLSRVRINASRPRHLQCCSAAHPQHEFSRILIFLHQDEKYLFFCLLQLPRQRDVTAAARYEAASGACCSLAFTVVREMQSSEPYCSTAHYIVDTQGLRSHAFNFFLFNMF